ncbi:hypothetical protein [Trichococcus shcherbakoviae]|uniref:hypothetical protein n=1 Tax=Trichococcus shcherbakoviae TaxID=2094020 RepID=UPI002AA65B2C|nr:hypothetical protein [Trichococcus shcherbakoviae]
MPGLNAIFTKLNGDPLESESGYVPPGMYHAKFQGFTEELSSDGGVIEMVAHFVVLAGPKEANL